MRTTEDFQRIRESLAQLNVKASEKCEKLILDLEQMKRMSERLVVAAEQNPEGSGTKASKGRRGRKRKR